MLKFTGLQQHRPRKYEETSQSWCPNVSSWSSSCLRPSLSPSLPTRCPLCPLWVRASVIRACPPASRTLQRPFEPFSGDTIMQLCEQTNAVYDSWGRWRWSNAIPLSSCPPPPSPSLPTVLTLNTPPSTPSLPPLPLAVIPGLSISAQGTVGKLCVSALPNNYLQLRLTAVWPSERLSH